MNVPNEENALQVQSALAEQLSSIPSSQGSPVTSQSPPLLEDVPPQKVHSPTMEPPRIESTFAQENNSPNTLTAAPYSSATPELSSTPLLPTSATCNSQQLPSLMSNSHQLPSLMSRSITPPSSLLIENLRASTSTPTNFHGQIGNSAKFRTKWFPCYMVMTMAKNDQGKSFASYSPFKVAKAIKSLSPETAPKFLKNGSVLLTVNNEKDLGNLQRFKTFDSTPVEILPHRSLNHSRGVIRANELLHCSEEELVEEFSSMGVVEARRIYRTINGIRTPTPTVVLKFFRPTLPERIKLDFMILRVRPYEPTPIQCRSCYRFRHTRANCQTVACGVCAEEHSEGPCRNAPKCVNCAGPHPAFSRNCKIYMREKAIEKIRETEKVSYDRAEQIYKRSAPPNPDVTFSQAVKAGPNSNSKAFPVSTTLPAEAESGVTPAIDVPPVPAQEGGTPSLPVVPELNITRQLTQLAGIIDTISCRLLALERHILPSGTSRTQPSSTITVPVAELAQCNSRDTISPADVALKPTPIEDFPSRTTSNHKNSGKSPVSNPGGQRNAKRPAPRTSTGKESASNSRPGSSTSSKPPQSKRQSKAGKEVTRAGQTPK